MGYEESVIIPLELYKKECTKEHKNEAEKILKREDIPTDIKIKLFDQTLWQKSSKKKKETKGQRTLPSYAINQIPLAVQPFVRNIVQQYINHHRNIIDWDPNTFELIINGERRFDSNIIRSFQNIMRGKEDILKDKLLEIGVPKEWVSQKIRDENSAPVFSTSDLYLTPQEKEYILPKPKKDLPPEEEKKKDLLTSPISWVLSSKTPLKTEPSIPKVRRSGRIIKRSQWKSY